MIHVVDYGLGNVGAFLTLYRQFNIPAVAAATPTELERADHVILPGVGAFDHAIALLQQSGMRDCLEDLVQRRKIPVLGVCVGMQMLGDGSEEGALSGLGWIPGTVRSLAGRDCGVGSLPMPHMGWNDVVEARRIPLLVGLDRPRYYFLHSYYFDNANASDCAATVDYGERFTCIVNRDNVWGVQFHPEKSHRFGIGLLKNFAAL